MSIYKHLFEGEIVIAGKDDHCVVHGVLLLLLDRVRRFDCDDLYLKRGEEKDILDIHNKSSSQIVPPFHFILSLARTPFTIN